MGSPLSVRVSRNRPVAASNPAVAQSGRASRMVQLRKSAALSFKAISVTLEPHHCHQLTNPGLSPRSSDGKTDCVHRLIIAHAAYGPRQCFSPLKHDLQDEIKHALTDPSPVLARRLRGAAQHKAVGMLVLTMHAISIERLVHGNATDD